MKKVYVLKGSSYGDFDVCIKESLLICETKEIANKLIKILEGFVKNDCVNYAKSIGYDLYSDDLTFGFFFNKKDCNIKNNLILSLSEFMTRTEAQEFSNTLTSKDIYCNENVFSVEEMMFL